MSELLDGQTTGASTSALPINTYLISFRMQFDLLAFLGTRKSLLQHHNLKASIPWGSDSKESACNAGDRGSSPGWARSPGEGNGNPL